MGAERLIARAFRLQPTVPQLRSNVGAIWAALGRTDEAERWLDGVLETHPRVTAARNWRVFVDLGRAAPREALRLALAYAEDEASSAAALGRVAFSALLARDFGLAGEYAERAIGLSVNADPFDLRRMETVLALVLVREGRSSEGARAAREAIEAVRRAVSRGADGWDPPWELAAAHAVVGEHPESLGHLAEAVDRGFPHTVLLRLDPAFDDVRADPSFQALVRRVEVRADDQRRRSMGPGG